MATRSEVTSGFGDRIHPVDGVYRMHSGVDLAAAPSQPIQAAAPGKVISAGWHGAHGLVVEVQHAGGLRTRYSHLSALLVEEGATVEAGSTLGLAGDTGLTTGVHLHFEVWKKGTARNPLKWFHRRAPGNRQFVTRPIVLPLTTFVTSKGSS
jgi:murein DD-endopeptidase MepM/ murein hydrolase activator NlpD